MRFRNGLLAFGLLTFGTAAAVWNFTDVKHRVGEQLRQEMALFTNAPVQTRARSAEPRPAAAKPAVQEEKKPVTLEQKITVSDKPLLGPAIIESRIAGKRALEKFYARDAIRRYTLAADDHVKVLLPKLAKQHEQSGYSVRWLPKDRILADKQATYAELLPAGSTRTEGHVGLYKGDTLCESYKVGFDVQISPKLAKTIPSLQDIILAEPPTTKAAPVQPAQKYTGVRITQEDGRTVNYEDLPLSRDAAQRIVQLPRPEAYQAQRDFDKAREHLVRITSSSGTTYIDPFEVGVPSLQEYRSAR